MKLQLSPPSQGVSHIASLLRSALTAWLFAAWLEYWLLPKELRPLAGLEQLAAMSAPRAAAVGAVVFVCLVLLGRLSPRPIGGQLRWAPVFLFALYATSAVINSFTWPFFFACVLCFGILLRYAAHGWDASAPRPTQSGGTAWPWALLTCASAGGFLYLTIRWGIDRCRSFCAATFDFGIFSQLFYNLSATGQPVTTLERAGLTSHFSVHVSPILYLLVPFYRLYPHPETLAVLQAALLASAAVPLWMLGKRSGLPPWARWCSCALLLLYPAYAGGIGYDFHENCALTPLLLWLLYALDARRPVLSAVFAVLTLAVKEDAATYVAVIGLYIFLRGGLHRERYDIAAGAALFAGAVAWFAAVTAYLSASGEGVMNWRYSNFTYTGEDSLVTLVKAVLLCPLKAVYECVDSEKLSYIGLTLLPLAGLPLLTRRYERCILLIPYILVNLMSDYSYQHDILFQYSFGSAACLAYLAVVNLAEICPSGKQVVSAGLALCLSVSCFREKILPEAQKYSEYCTEYAQFYASQQALLDWIPEGVSVAATTYYTAYLSSRSQLYDIHYCSPEQALACDYVALKVSDEGSLQSYATEDASGYENFKALLLSAGFRLLAEYPGVTEIYTKIT